MSYIAWALVTLALIGATVYLVINVSAWFVLLMLFMPSLTNSKDDGKAEK